MRLLLVFGRTYPRHTAVMLACQILAALAEGLALSALLPLFAMLGGGDSTAGMPGGSTEASAKLGQIITEWLAVMGVEPSPPAFLVVVFAGLVLKALLILLAQRQVGYTVAHVATDLRVQLVRALMRARWDYFVKQPVGVLANAFATEAFRASQAYLFGTMMAALAIQAAVYTAIAFFVSLEMALASVVVGTFAVFAMSRLIGMTRKAGNRQTVLMKALLSRLTDMLYALKPLKAMGREDAVGPLLESETESLNHALQREVFSREALRAMQELVIASTVIVGPYFALTTFNLPSESVGFLAIVYLKLLSHLYKVQRQYQRLTACESAYWSLAETIEEAESSRERVAGTERPTLTRAVELRDVEIGYGDRTVLDGASITVPAGELTLIVGPSGAGKTSLIDAVVGLVRPRSGDVWVDDRPLESLDLALWRSRIGYVPQETTLLHQSVLLNVTLGDPTFDRAAVEEALRTAGAWEFVSVLPEGVDTSVGERGTRFSGGQRQRIALARALVHHPDLLILDEATASLDPVSEAAICDVLVRLRGKITILAVSHQTGLLSIAERVYKITDGRPVAEGA